MCKTDIYKFIKFLYIMEKHFSLFCLLWVSFSVFIVNTLPFFRKTWYNKGSYAYICFDAVIPEYSGEGIFKLLDNKREQLATGLGYKTLVFDTHSRNVHRQQMAERNGYRLVRFFRAASKDHYSVVMAKWLDGCPHSSFYCWMKYKMSWMNTMLRFPLNKRHEI